MLMILGIDPGIRKLGYALIENNLSIVDAGVVLLKQKKSNTSDSPVLQAQKILSKKEDWRLEQWERMDELYTFFSEMVMKYEGQIDCVCVEKLFFTGNNQSNAEYVYGIRGALMMLFHRHGIRLIEYTPIQLKKYVTGNSKANKDLMMAVIKNIFGLQEDLERHDTADALGLAWLAQKVVGNEK